MGLELELHVPASLPYFPHHFPDHGMLPGVVQLGWAILFAARHLGFDGPMRKVTNLKFLHPIQPGTDLTLSLERVGERDVAFSYSTPRRQCSSGRLKFVDV